MIKGRKPSMIVVGALAVVLGAAKAEATTFCNMDDSGGGGGRQGQRQAAEAAASFFNGAASAFEMFASLEKHAAGDRGALGQAKNLAEKSTYQLQSAARDFKAVGHAPGSLREIGRVIRQLSNTDYGDAFKAAQYAMESVIGTEIRGHFSRGEAMVVMHACGASIEGLINKERPMGEVFSEVQRGVVPAPDQTWRAIAQWNEVLIRGRIISAIFRIASKYKP